MFHPFALWLRQNATAAPCFLYGGWLKAWAGHWDTRWTVGQTSGQVLDAVVSVVCLEARTARCQRMVGIPVAL